MQLRSFLAFFIFMFWLLLTPGMAATRTIEPVKRQVEVVFVLDTTGSMANLIDGAKKKIWSIANAIIDQHPNAEIRMGLVGYRDVDDTYVTKHFPLTTDMQSIYANLLRFEADEGGDTPESVNEALDVAVTKMGWTDPQQVRADRILFLVGDAPPHMDYQQDRKYPVVIKEAVQKGIIVNAVQAGDDRETLRVWREMASLGHGDYLAIPQSGGTVIIIATPYDAEITELQIRLNKTVVPYGHQEQRREVKSKTEMYSSAPAASAAEMSKYVNKSAEGKAVITGQGDLVADMENGVQKLDTLKDEDLPAELQKMPPAERKAYMESKAKERETLANQLAELVNKRDQYIAQEMKKAPATPADSFDASVNHTIKQQMK